MKQKHVDMIVAIDANTFNVAIENAKGKFEVKYLDTIEGADGTKIYMAIKSRKNDMTFKIFGV